jgi:hypothetical protein
VTDDKKELDHETLAQRLEKAFADEKAKLEHAGVKVLDAAGEAAGEALDNR